MRMPRMVLPLIATVAVAGGAAATTAATHPSLTVTPSTVHRGGQVTFTGSGWAHRVRVKLLLSKPGLASANTITTVVTTRRGRFRYTVPIKPTSPTGEFEIRACRKNCAVKVTRKLTILE